MNKFNYSEAREVAKSLIEEFGEASSFVVAGANSGGLDKWGKPIPAEPDIIISGTVTPLLSFKQNEIDGEQIKATDGYVYFHSEVEPPIDSKITINSLVYRAVNIKKLDSVGDINVYRRVQLRK